MKKYIVLISLALLTLTFAVLEGLIELPAQFVQVNGLLTIICAAVFIGLSLKVQVERFNKD